MRRFLHLLGAMTRFERWALMVLSVVFLLSTAGLLRLFYLQNTILIPAPGGTYIEGSVGSLQPLNPWFTVANDVNRDIVSLVFAGLLKYNPQTKKIEEDLATMKISGEGKIYTLTLKDNLFWQDSTEEDPHPVTADDVLFTFQTIQQSGFPNALLQQNFRGVTLKKINDHTVQFTLEQPYSFFSSNLTLGLLPARSFEGIPVGKLDQTLDFGYKPVGAGPYHLKTIVQTDLSSEVTLEKFPRSLEPPFRLDRVVFRIFPDYGTLLSDLRNLQGVRLVPRNDKGEPVIPKSFKSHSYTLPQYVALFLNLSKPALQDEKLRLGLQLGTDKQEIADTVHESTLMDTPLLEINTSDWHYKYDADAAQGALFSSRWNLPEKVRLQHLLEQDEANRIGALRAPPVVYLPEGSALTLTGSLKDFPVGSAINGVKIQKSTTTSGSWIASLTATGSGGLKVGENLLRVTDEKNRVVDSFYLQRFDDARLYQRAADEQHLLQIFLQSRAGTPPTAQRIGAADFFLEQGMLRRRQPSDAVSIRRNDHGDLLKLTLLTSSAPASYRIIAEKVQQQWRKLGVDVTIDIPKTSEEFQQKLQKREYDVLLFGESLLDNLDSFPYWHSSGVQKLTGQVKDLRLDAYNLSQYQSFEADSLLETIRRTADEKERQRSLKGLSDVLKRDTPAIVLYSPLYTFAHDQNILGVELGSLSLHSDRFLTLYKWYVKQDRIFKTDTGWGSIFGWIPSLFGKK